MNAGRRQGAIVDVGVTREYRYTQEISQMVSMVTPKLPLNMIFLQMFVFGEVQDPNNDTVNLIEDIVRSQLVELVRAPLQPQTDFHCLMLCVDPASACFSYSQRREICFR